MTANSIKESKPSLTVVIPAYLEAADLRPTYQSVMGALARAGITNYEIVLTTATGVLEDDGTSAAAAEIARENPHVCHVDTIQESGSPGLGYIFGKGLERSTKEFVAMVPAHNLTAEDSLQEIFRQTGTAESIITYTSNPEVRPWRARFVSKGFVLLANLLFGLKVRYYNGIFIHRRTLLKAIPMSADGHAYMAEIIIYLAKSGRSFLEVPQKLKSSNRTGRSWNLRSVAESLKTLTALFFKIRFKRIKIAI